jgi:hypothetical protein
LTVVVRGKALTDHRQTVTGKGDGGPMSGRIAFEGYGEE